MQKKTKRLLLGGGIALAVLVAIPVVMLALMNKTMEKEVKKMTPLETQEVVPGVYALRDNNVDMYLVKHNTGYLAIDAGKSPEIIRAGLAKLNIQPEQVTDVFLTHSDEDHAGGLAVFGKAKVFLFEKEEQMVNGQKTRFFIFKNTLSQAHTLVADQETLEIGHRQLTFIGAPGHTPGSMCVLIDGVYLFVGDALSIKEGTLQAFVPMFTMDMDTHKQTLAHLKANVINKVKYVFSAHFGYLEVKEP